MATSTTDMPLSGGHPALDFANTVDSRRGRWGPDLLHSYDDVIVLAQRLALIGEAQAGQLSALAKAHPARAIAVAKEAVRQREAIYAIFRSEDARQPYPAAAFETIHNKARRARGRQVLTETRDGFRWRLPLTGLTDLTGMFAVAAAELITGRDHTAAQSGNAKATIAGGCFLILRRADGVFGVPRPPAARTHA